MLFAIFCTDKPNSTDIRTATRAQHLEYLEGVLDRIILVGPTFADDLTTMNGSVLILEFSDQSQAEDFAAHDPYAKAGLFESVIIRPWKQVFPTP